MNSDFFLIKLHIRFECEIFFPHIANEINENLCE